MPGAGVSRRIAVTDYGLRTHASHAHACLRLTVLTMGPHRKSNRRAAGTSAPGEPGPGFSGDLAAGDGNYGWLGAEKSPGLGAYFASHRPVAFIRAHAFEFTNRE